jgi:hypothetical protein
LFPAIKERLQDIQMIDEGTCSIHWKQNKLHRVSQNSWASQDRHPPE